MRVSFTSYIVFVILTELLFGQSFIQVSGKIISDGGSIISDGSVEISGTDLTFKTNSEGQFSFPLSTRYNQIILLAPGYEQRSLSLNQPNLGVIMLSAPGTTNTISGDSIKSKEDYPDTVYEKLNRMPEFPGGLSALFKEVNKLMIYPPRARKYGMEGRVIVDFIVRKDGSISHVKSDVQDEWGLGNEAVRIFKNISGYKPGYLNGQPVNTKMSYPVKFSLRNLDGKKYIRNLMVEYPGGISALNQFIKTNQIVPRDTLLPNYDENTLKLSLFINAQGFIVSYVPLNDLGLIYLKEAERLLGLFPRFKVTREATVQSEIRSVNIRIYFHKVPESNLEKGYSRAALARTQLEDGKINKARISIEEAISYNPYDLNFYVERALIIREQGFTNEYCRQLLHLSQLDERIKRGFMKFCQ